MTQQEKQINYMGPFITMVFLFFIVGFLTTANTQFQGLEIFINFTNVSLNT